MSESPPPTDRAGDVGAVVQSALAAIGRAGRISAAGLSDAVEGAARSLARRVVNSAIAAPRLVDERKALARALAEHPNTPRLGGATAAALATRFASRLGPLRFLAKRTPMWLVAAAAPALIASVNRGSRTSSDWSHHTWCFGPGMRTSSPTLSACAGSPSRC